MMYLYRSPGYGRREQKCIEITHHLVHHLRLITAADREETEM